MRKLILFLLSLLLVSCNTGNLYQDIGLGSKPKLIIIDFSCYKIPDDGKVNLFSLFTDNPYIELNLTFSNKTDSSYLLKSQSKSEIENMTSLLTAPCFSNKELSDFLNSRVEDLVLLDSIHNAELAIKDTETTVLSLISNLSSVKISKEEYPDLSDEIITSFNSYIDQAESILTSFFTSFYSSLNDFLATGSNTWLWKDYLRVQLTLDLIGSVLEGIDASYITIVNSSSNIPNKSFDFTTEEGIKEYLSFIKENFSSTGKKVIVNLVSPLLMPLACYLNITSTLENMDLGLVSVDDVLELLLGEKK